MVAAIAQELIEQVAVGAVNLHPVEAGGGGVAGGVAEPLHDAGQFVVGELAGHHVGLFARGGANLIARDRNRTGGHRLEAGVEQGMAGPAAVPELQHDAPAGGMHRVGGESPPLHLGL